MTSDQDKCGLSSLLTMSCRQRAEAFADRLRSRLTSLDTENINGTVNENSWLSPHKDTLALSQPKHSTEYSIATNFYLHLDTPESPGEEIDHTNGFINEDDLISITNPSQFCPDNLFQNALNMQYDSDSSDGPFYDCQGDVTQVNENKTKNATHLNGTECDVKENHTSTPEDDLERRNNEEESLEIDDTNTQNVKIVEAVEKIQVTITQSSLESEPFFVHDSSEDTEADEKTPRVRRCSSLKTGKTPPGTPARKKIVRFADVLGLDLADVRTFLDEIPKIPISAFNDLNDVDVKTQSVGNTTQKFNSIVVEKILVPLFQQPGGQPNFLDRIRENEVCLDSAVVEDPVTFAIKGVVRVRNLDFHKTVHVRYTLDCWKNFVDVQATYVENSCDGFSDKFSFMLYGNSVAVGDKLEFAIRFQCKGFQFWDNNCGVNYCFQCLPASNSTREITLPDDNWSSSFY